MDPSTSLADAVHALGRAHVEEILLPILVQLILIIFVARVAAYLARKVGQSAVIGEIAAGLILGPSLLSQFAFIHGIFHPTISNVPHELADLTFHWIFTVLSQIGLILLLFLIGLEFDFSHLKFNGVSAVTISLAGIVLPFGLGIAIAPVLLGHPDLGHHPAANGPAPFWHFALFLGTALSITALPVLGRLLMELNIHRTRLGAIGITSAAVDDAMGWILLAAVAAIVQGSQGGTSFGLGGPVLMLMLTVAFALAMIFIARPWVIRGLRATMVKGKMTVSSVAALLCAILIGSIATNLIGIFAVFGAFLCGAILSSEKDLRDAIRGKMRDFVTAFFLPIFFTYTGLRTNVQALGSFELWMLCGLVLAAAVVGKFGGCYLAARFSGMNNHDAVCVGTMMNTRALMELIVINVGYDLRVIPPSVFAMLVLMALITTVMCTPLLTRFLRGTELEPLILQSSLYRGEEPSDEEPSFEESAPSNGNA